MVGLAILKDFELFTGFWVYDKDILLLSGLSKVNRTGYVSENTPVVAFEMTHEKATLAVIMLVRYSYLHDSPCFL